MGIVQIFRAGSCFGKNSHKFSLPFDQIFISNITVRRCGIPVRFSVRHFTNFPRIFCINFQGIFRDFILIPIRKDTERIDPWHIPIYFHLCYFINILKFEANRLVSIACCTHAPVFWHAFANALSF